RHRLLWALERHPQAGMAPDRRPLACDMLDLLRADDAAPAPLPPPRALGARAPVAAPGNWFSETVAARTVTVRPHDASSGTVTIVPPAVPAHWWEVGPSAAVLLREVEWVLWNTAL